jgi:hypothetical protein
MQNRKEWIWTHVFLSTLLTDWDEYIFNHLKHNGNYIYHLIWHSITLPLLPSEWWGVSEKVIEFFRTYNHTVIYYWSHIQSARVNYKLPYKNTNYRLLITCNYLFSCLRVKLAEA